MYVWVSIIKIGLYVKGFLFLQLKGQCFSWAEPLSPTSIRRETHGAYSSASPADSSEKTIFNVFDFVIGGIGRAHRWKTAEPGAWVSTRWKQRRAPSWLYGSDFFFVYTSLWYPSFKRNRNTGKSLIYSSYCYKLCNEFSPDIFNLSRLIVHWWIIRDQKYTRRFKNVAHN